MTLAAPVRVEAVEPPPRRRGWMVAVAAVALVGLGTVAWAASGDDAQADDETVAEVAANVEPAPEPEPEPVPEPEAEAPVPVAEPEPTLVAIADTTPVDDAVEPEVEAKPRKQRRRRRPRKAEPEPEPTPEPETYEEPEPEPAPPPPSAASLLREGKAAMSRGEFAAAYRLAKRSHGKRPSPVASTLMARAACRTGNKGNAKAALKQLSLSDRLGVRKDCRQAGTRIGL